MCGRYWIGESPELQEITEEMNRSPLVGKWRVLKGIKSSGEIRPTDVVPVIAPDRKGQRAVFPMKWGYTGKSVIINARAETASEKPTFRDDWKSHRCIVPGSWYFEWEHIKGNDGKVHTGDRYILQPKDSEMVWLCGLYRIEEGLPVFVILTKEAAGEIRFIHDRMPVMLTKDKVSEWIRPDAVPEEIMRDAVRDVCWENDRLT